MSIVLRILNHKALQVENETGVEAKEEIGDSQENLCTISFLLPRSWKLLYCIHVEICYSEIFSNSYILPS